MNTKSKYFYTEDDRFNMNTLALSGKAIEKAFHSSLIAIDTRDEKLDINTFDASLKIIEKVQCSSLMAVGVFDGADQESAFFADWMTNDVIARINLPLETVQEMQAHEDGLGSDDCFDGEDEIHSKIAASEIIWQIRDNVRQNQALLGAIMKRK